MGDGLHTSLERSIFEELRTSTSSFTKLKNANHSLKPKFLFYITLYEGLSIPLLFLIESNDISLSYIINHGSILYDVVARERNKHVVCLLVLAPFFTKLYAERLFTISGNHVDSYVSRYSFLRYKQSSCDLVTAIYILVASLSLFLSSSSILKIYSRPFIKFSLSLLFISAVMVHNLILIAVSIVLQTREERILNKSVRLNGS